MNERIKNINVPYYLQRHEAKVKIGDIWHSLSNERDALLKDIHMYEEYDEHIEMFNEWLQEEGEEMRRQHLALNFKKIEPSRVPDLSKSLESIHFHMDRKKEGFDKHNAQSYLDWLFEVPYLIEDKLIAYDALNPHV